jgi:hypothetical protein
MQPNTDTKLLEQYGLTRQHLMSLFLYLAFLPAGKEVYVPNGRIQKTTEDTFQLIVDDGTINAVAEEFMTRHTELRKDIFKK